MHRASHTASLAGRTSLAGITLVVALVLTGCSSGDTSALGGPPTTSATPPGWVGGVEGQNVAAAGDDLVFAGNSCEGHDPVLRRADGTWVQLPAPPDPINLAVPVGDTVVLWGSDGCGGDAWYDDTPRLRMAMLSEDRTEWRRLDAPAIEIDSETESGTLGWAGDAAVVFVAGTQYLVERSGRVSALPDRPGGTGLECVTAQHMVAVAQIYDTTSPVTPEVGTTGSVVVLDLAAPGDGWQTREPVPAGTTSVLGGDLCGPDGLSLIDRTTAADYSVTADTWTTPTSNFVELAQTTEVPAQWALKVAWAPDGSTSFVVARDGRVLAREGHGLWTDTGRTATSLVGTASEVIGITSSITDALEDGPAPSFEQLWPAR